MKKTKGVSEGFTLKAFSVPGLLQHRLLRRGGGLTMTRVCAAYAVVLRHAGPGRNTCCCQRSPDKD